MNGWRRLTTNSRSRRRTRRCTIRGQSRFLLFWTKQVSGKPFRHSPLTGLPSAPCSFVTSSLGDRPQQPPGALSAPLNSAPKLPTPKANFWQRTHLLCPRPREPGKETDTYISSGDLVTPSQDPNVALCGFFNAQWGYVWPSTLNPTFPPKSTLISRKSHIPQATSLLTCPLVRRQWFDILENERLCKKQFLISSGFLVHDNRKLGSI